MQYKFHEHRYTFNGQFAYAADCIRHSLDMMGYTEAKTDIEADLHIYNHTARDLEPNMQENSIIFKPTAPTGQHFQICREGYANSSAITFDDPCWWAFSKYTNEEWNEIQEMVNRRANKWDSAELFKWEEATGKLKDDHILIVGQMPEDETVKGFGFGNHWDKMCQIIEKLKDRNLVIKLHPRISKASHIIRDLNKTILQWENDGHQVITGYVSIHSILPKTKVAIIENSTAGIECMMHDVPIISYGYPDYHWITKDLRILTRLNSYIDNLNWFDKNQSREFLCWYVFRYLCSDIPTTQKRLGELLNAN